jgi:cobalamin biosynthesis protein CobC
MLEHGGDLTRASKEYGIRKEDWLDLSTGINPLGYPVPAVPAQDWLRLPDDSNPVLLQTARDYYQADWLLPVAGSQAAIRALPRIRPRSRVLVSALTYNEHAHAWQRGGHAVRAVRMRECEAHLSQTDVLIVCNPNNPTGELIERAQLLEWHANLAAHGKVFRPRRRSCRFCVRQRGFAARIGGRTRTLDGVRACAVRRLRGAFKSGLASADVRRPYQGRPAA